MRWRANSRLAGSIQPFLDEATSLLRETYIVLGPDEFVERFELAEPGKDFGLYSQSRLRRVGGSR